MTAAKVTGGVHCLGKVAIMMACAVMGIFKRHVISWSQNLFWEGLEKDFSGKQAVRMTNVENQSWLLIRIFIIRLDSAIKRD